MKENESFKCCDSLGYKIAHTLKAMIGELCLRFEEQGIDLTPEQFFILNLLNDNPDLILQDVADMIEKDKSAVARHVNALEEKHFVTRVTYKKDKRKKLLILTKPGMKTLQKANKISEEAEAKLTAQIDEKKLESFEQVLLKIVNKSQAVETC